MGKFPKSSYRIGVSTLQAVALSVLSGQTAPMTFEDVGQAMGCVTENGGVNEDIVKRVLHSLSCNPKYRVLKKTGPGNPKVVNAEDKFEPNPAFSSKARRFTIPMADLDNLGATLQKVHQDRSYLIDACVVRIMKARKRLGHQTLLSEVAQQLQTFKATVPDIKKRIENLIEREFLQRTEVDGEWTKEYDYLA